MSKKNKVVYFTKQALTVGALGSVANVSGINVIQPFASKLPAMASITGAGMVIDAAKKLKVKRRR